MILLSVIVGLIFGSFISLVSYRIVQGDDIVIKPSRCTICNHQLGALDLIPLFSWMLNLGKCRHCKNRISPRYPLIEIFVAFLSLFTYIRFGLTLEAALVFLSALCIAILIITDFEHYIIPDSIQIIMGLLAICLGVVNDLSLYNLISGAVIACCCGIILRALFLWWKKQDALGMGDIKFLVVVGLYLGISPLPIFFFISGILGIITGVLWEKCGKGKIFPFGPALASSMMICLFFPNMEQSFLQLISNFVMRFI
jgi:prepilin signal peptidase PulO-like enzyme (type II secretory pathway)